MDCNSFSQPKTTLSGEEMRILCSFILPSKAFTNKQGLNAWSVWSHSLEIHKTRREATKQGLCSFSQKKGNGEGTALKTAWCMSEKPSGKLVDHVHNKAASHAGPPSVPPSHQGPGPSGASLRCAALTWGGEWNLARTRRVDAVAALRQTADRNVKGEAHVRQERYVGTASATPADLFRADHTLSPGLP